MDNGTYSVKVKQTINNVDSADSVALANVVISATPIAAPSAPDLQTASDLGFSNSDNITSDNTPTFSAAGPFAGTAVLTATKAGSTTVTCTISANACTTTALADGDWVITVTDTDAAGNTATSTPITITVDTTVPTVSSVTSSNSDGRYKAGETITVLVTFSETVTVTGTPLLTLETGATDRTASYVSGSGTNTLAFQYVVQSGDSSADLNYLATTSLALNGGTILDIAGKIATLTLPALAGGTSLAGSKAIVVDAITPTISAFSSTNTDKSYKTGDSIVITATASEAVRAGSFVTVTLETGVTDRQVVLTAGADGTTLSGTYTVQAGDTSADLTALSFSVGATDVVDLAGNYLSSTTMPTGANNIAGAKAIVVDANAPTATLTTASMLPAASAVVQSSEAGTAYLVNTSITVSDSASITTADGTLWNTVPITTANTNTNLSASGLVPGTYKAYTLDAAGNLSAASSGTVTILPPTPTPAPDLQAGSDSGSSSTDNNTVDTTPTFDVAGLTSGAIVTLTATPSSGPAATCTFTASTTTGSCTFSPAIANGTYSVVVSQNVNGIESAASSALTNLAINASAISTPSTPDLAVGSDLGQSNTDNLTSDNTPTFSLPGPFAGTAVLTATKAGSTTVTCTVSANACTTTSLANGDWVITVTDTDAAGNTATSAPLTITIDTTAATVTSVSSSKNDGRYKTGETITVLVTFSESVTVTGAPRLLLETGATDRNATYASGSGSNVLAFTYVIQAGDTSSDLTYAATNSLSLNGGTILDLAGTASTLTLVDPAATGSLGANKAIVVDTTPPTVTLARAGPTASTSAIVFTVTGNENIDCSSLSTSNGVDFNFTNISSISSIIQSSATVCTINAISSALSGAEIGRAHV
jgi:hypothetical protein